MSTIWRNGAPSPMIRPIATTGGSVSVSNLGFSNMLNESHEAASAGGVASMGGGVRPAALRRHGILEDWVCVQERRNRMT
jgi:hypothetical protein